MYTTPAIFISVFNHKLKPYTTPQIPAQYYTLAKLNKYERRKRHCDKLGVVCNIVKNCLPGLFLRFCVSL